MIEFFGVTFFGILAVLLLLGCLIFWVWGIVLSFRASIILTILCFFLHIPFIVFGVCRWAFGVDLPREIVDALRRR